MPVEGEYPSSPPLSMVKVMSGMGVWIGVAVGVGVITLIVGVTDGVGDTGVTVGVTDGVGVGVITLGVGVGVIGVVVGVDVGEGVGVGSRPRHKDGAKHKSKIISGIRLIMNTCSGLVSPRTCSNYGNADLSCTACFYGQIVPLRC